MRLPRLLNQCSDSCSRRFSCSMDDVLQLAPVGQFLDATPGETLDDLPAFVVASGHDELDVVQQRHRVFEDGLVAMALREPLPVVDAGSPVALHVVVDHLAVGVMVIADGVHAPQHLFLEVEGR
jgi:hypothetical protein